LAAARGWRDAAPRTNHPISHRAPATIAGAGQIGGAEVEALHRAILELAAKALALLQPQAAAPLGQMLTNTEEPLQLVYLLGSMLNLDLVREQSILEAQTPADALRLMHGYLTYEVQVLELRQKIAGQAQHEMSREQREYFLRQQLRAIQQELGEQNPEQAEIGLLRERLEKEDLPEDVRKEAERELQRLERLPTASPEHHIVRSYLELVLELPWRKSTESALDLARARQILDEDHYDLKEVKERNPRTAGGAQTESRGQSTHPVLRRPSGGGQNILRAVDCACLGTHLRAHEPGWHA